MNITLVYNPKSGSSRSLAELRALFTKHGITISKVIPIKKGFETQLKTPIENSEYIAVIGGDGTISAVAGLVAETCAILIPLPGGTLNHFTKDLCIDQDLDSAIADLATASTRSIDIAQVNNLYFVNNSSIGLYPSSLHVRRHLEDRLGKWLAALIGGLRVLIRYRTYDVAVNGQHVTTPFIFVGNNDYQLDTLGFQGRTSLSGGSLSVYIVNAHTRWGLVKVFAHAIVGKLNISNDFISFKAKSLTITSKHRHLSISHDGEVSHVEPPVTYEIKSKKLTIL